MTEDEIRERLKDRVLSRVADATGLHYATVRRFMAGKKIPNPLTIKLLAEYLAR